MTEFYLVTGFLGSGKTTLLRNILMHFSAQKKIAVIQNEFAPTGADGKELRNTGKEFKLVEINNGSVFCLCMLGNFIEKLEGLLNDYEPEMVFLEASGLADPVNIIELLMSANLRNKISLSGIICIADAVNFYRGLNTLPRFRHQIMIADTILVNKTDLISSGLPAIHEEIKKMNPFSEIINTSYTDTDPEKLLYGINPDHKSAEKLRGKRSEGRPPVNAVVLRSHKKMKSADLLLFLDELQKVSIRIKGSVMLDDDSSLAVQTVYDQRNLEKADNPEGTTELIVFSEKLTPRELRLIYNRF